MVVGSISTGGFFARELASRPAIQTPIADTQLHGAACIAQFVEHALRKRTVVGSVPMGGFLDMLFDFTCLASSASAQKLCINFEMLGRAAEISQ